MVQQLLRISYLSNKYFFNSDIEEMGWEILLNTAPSLCLTKWSVLYIEQTCDILALKETSGVI